MSFDTDWMDAEEAPQELVAPKKPRRLSKNRRPAALVKAERSLSLEQRYYVRMLTESNTYREAQKRLINAGFPKRDRATYWRWRQNDKVAEALSLLQDWQYACSHISKARLVSDAEKIKQIALRPKPILYKGKATKFKEVDTGVALRAVEFQGKAIGINDPDQRGVTVNIDIDFSGRVDGIDVEPIEGEFEETMAVD